MPPNRAAAALAIAALAATTPAFAQTPQPDSGDTAWMLAATALVLFMTVPGLALFYAGMVRAKNVLSVMMQCFAITALVSVLWVAYGYSLAFDTTGMQAGDAGIHAIVGTLRNAFLAGMTRDSLAGTISRESVRDVPDDVRDHHAGTDRRRIRGAHEVQGAARVRRGLVHARVRAERAHGLGRARLAAR